jgi:hypothetical protein
MGPLWIFHKDFISSEPAKNHLNYKNTWSANYLETAKNSARLDFKVQATVHRARAKTRPLKSPDLLHSSQLPAHWNAK